MFERRILATICAAGVLFPCAGEARDINLGPTSKWVMNYDRDSCTLARSFGEGDDKIVAQFVKYAPGASFGFNVVGKPLTIWRDRSEVGLRFGASGEFTTAHMRVAQASTDPKESSIALLMSGRLDNRDMRRTDEDTLTDAERAALLSITPTIEATISTVSLAAGGSTVTLELGSMRAPMAAMNKCTTSLVAAWGLDPTALDSLAALPRPRNSPAMWVSAAEYPTHLLARSSQALIRYRLMVDIEGNPSGCFVQSSIGDAQFSKATCDLLKKRARFFPARSKDGSSVAWYYVGGISWMVPK